jgi:glycerophosphoryl diester phosphodiesterase
MTLVIAHRGASAYAPENTMAAFELAARQGADMCELDVQPTADGQLAVFHDETTERWDGRPTPAASLTLAQLQQLDIGGERVATLAEVCHWAREHGMRLNVELKGGGFGAPVARLLHESGVRELVLISSFYPQALREIAQADPSLPRAYLMGTRTRRPDVRLRESWPFGALRRAGVQAWHPAYQIPLLERVLPLVRRAGYQVNVWTVNDPAVMRQLIALDADGIITDTPDVLRAIISEGSSKSTARS